MDLLLIYLVQFYRLENHTIDVLVEQIVDEKCFNIGELDVLMVQLLDQLIEDLHFH